MYVNIKNIIKAQSTQKKGSMGGSTPHTRGMHCFLLVNFFTGFYYQNALLVKFSTEKAHSLKYSGQNKSRKLHKTSRKLVQFIHNKCEVQWNKALYCTLKCKFCTMFQQNYRTC